MIKNKKIYYLTAVIVAAVISISGLNCSRPQGRKSGESTVKVTVTDIAANDLGQVMIFGISEGKRSIYVKSFYRADKNQRRVHEEIRKYLKGTAVFKGNDVTITCRKNSIGDMEVLDIR